MEPSVNTELLRSRVDTFILNSLSEKDGYGYDILNYIYTQTQGHYEMKQSSIYSVLKRLEKQGYIKSYLGEESKGGQRRYYSLTDAGREFLDAEQKQWAYTRTLLDNLVTQKDFDLEKDTPPFKASDLRPLTRRNRNEDEETKDKEEKSEKSKEKDTQTALYEKAEQRKERQTQTVLAATVLSNAQSEPRVSQAQTSPQTEQSASSAQYTDLQKQARQWLFSPTALPNMNENERAEKTIPSLADENSEKDDRAAYRTLFNELYDKRADETKPALEAPIDDELNCRHINDLKNVLKNEGYTLKNYKKDEMLCDYTRNRLYYSNRLFRDCALLTFLFYALAVLIVYRFRVEFGYSPLSLLIVGLCGLVIPFSGLLKYFIEPKRRIKAVFNFRIIFAYSIMAYLLIFVLNLIISLVTPSISLTLRDAKLYPPAIIALTVPISVVFYQILFKSGFYSIKV